ncbi:MAG: hypothetical protein RLZZ292_2786, partial [Bacteroidota bacterium]
MMKSLTLKKIDKLLVKAFIPPFILFSVIALFVQVLQQFWLYIDEIMGKGVGIGLVSTLLFYLSVYFVPLSMTLGVLVASVMVLGNFAEHYELSSMKSAGVSLMRVLRPLIITCIVIAAFSFICANYLSPIANLHFRALLNDVRRQKPTLSIVENVFNDSFGGITMRVGRKDKDERGIHDIMVYEPQITNSGTRLNETLARDGEMYMTEDKQYMVMRLREGRRYASLPDDANKKRRFPFVRTQFKEWNKVFDMSEFDLNRTDLGLYRSNQNVKTITELIQSIDSINKSMNERRASFGADIRSNYYYYHRIQDSIELQRQQGQYPIAPSAGGSGSVKPNTIDGNNSIIREDARKYDNTKKEDNSKKEGNSKFKNSKIQILSPSNSQKTTPPSISTPPSKFTTGAQKLFKDKFLKQDSTKKINEFSSLLATFDLSERATLAGKALASAQTIQAQAQTAINVLNRIREAQAKHVHELNFKFCMSAMCIVFLFVGAPMGSIIRKGGFGYGIMIAIIF